MVLSFNQFVFLPFYQELSLPRISPNPNLYWNELAFEDVQTVFHMLHLENEYQQGIQLLKIFYFHAIQPKTQQQ